MVSLNHHYVPREDVSVRSVRGNESREREQCWTHSPRPHSHHYPPPTPTRARTHKHAHLCRSLVDEKSARALKTLWRSRCRRQRAASRSRRRSGPHSCHLLQLSAAVAEVAAAPARASQLACAVQEEQDARAGAPRARRSGRRPRGRGARVLSSAAQVIGDMNICNTSTIQLTQSQSQFIF